MLGDIDKDRLLVPRRLRTYGLEFGVQAEILWAWKWISMGFGFGVTWRFMGSYKWSYKSPNMGYNYRYLTYTSTYNYP